MLLYGACLRRHAQDSQAYDIYPYHLGISPIAFQTNPLCRVLGPHIYCIVELYSHSRIDLLTYTCQGHEWLTGYDTASQWPRKQVPGNLPRQSVCLLERPALTRCRILIYLAATRDFNAYRGRERQTTMTNNVFFFHACISIPCMRGRAALPGRQGNGGGCSETPPDHHCGDNGARRAVSARCGADGIQSPVASITGRVVKGGRGRSKMPTLLIYTVCRT